jgi:hypothetical protein
MLWTGMLRVCVRGIVIGGLVVSVWFAAAGQALAEEASEKETSEKKTSAEPVAAEVPPQESTQEPTQESPPVPAAAASIPEPAADPAIPADAPAETPADPATNPAAEAAAQTTGEAALVLASMEDMAAYLGSVRQHVDSDPALAAAYLVFWSELKAGEGSQPGTADTARTARYFEEIAALATTVASEVGRQYGKDHQRFLVADVIKRTVAALSSKAAGALPGAKPDPAALAVSPEAERLLANLDVLTRPNATAEGRYRFSGQLRTVASIGSSAEVWNLCKVLPACVRAHDRVFAPAMAGVSLIADAKRRLKGDPGLAETELWKELQPLAAEMQGQVSKAGSEEARMAALKSAAAAHWQAAMQALPASAGMKAPESGAIAPQKAQLDALFSLGLAGAQIAGADKLANAFTIARKPALEFASLAAQGATASSLLTSMAGVALVVAGVQAIAMLDGNDAADQAASAQMRELITALDARTYGALRDASAEQLLAINALDARMAQLGLALDVVKTDVARLESAGRRRIAANWQSETGRRWSAFDAENDRCFSARRRDPDTGLLSRTDFRWCEERFLAGATLKARYANRSAEFVMDGRFAEVSERDYPFHTHWPLLLTISGMNQKEALALPDPVEWQQYTAALLRLYREHPAAPVEVVGRTETLTTLAASGARLRSGVRGLVLSGTGQGAVFRADLHRRALDEYVAKLGRLAERVEALDDPAAHPFGKRMTAGLGQSVPETGSRRTAIENLLRRGIVGASGLKTCKDASPDAFLANRDRITAEARRLFGSPVTPDEVASVWNREQINRLSLDADSFTAAIPSPWLWATTAGLGSIEACLTRLRPETLSFTREPGPLEDSLKGNVVMGADLEIRFVPGREGAAALGLERGAHVLLTQQTGGRACTFGYRNDDEGCSRAQCLVDVAPSVWGTERRLTAKHVSCGEAPLREQMSVTPAAYPAGLDAASQRLAALYWAQEGPRTRTIEADALRSDEFVDASAAWFSYFALSGTTLGVWPEPAEFLADLFAEGSVLAPREVVRVMLREHMDSGRMRKVLKTRIDEVMTRIEVRGRDLAAAGDPPLPQLSALDDTLDRIDLLRAAYGASVAGQR